MKRSQAFPTKYLSKDDINGPTVAVIENVAIETLGQGTDQEDKPILYFRGDVLKPMVCNGTNWDILESLYGEDSDGWLGKRIEIWVDPSVMFGGKRTGGLRVRAPHAAKVGIDGDYMTAEQAKAAVLAAGLTVDDLKAILPERDGKRLYSPERDSDKVHELIRQNTQPAEEGLPF